MPPVVHTNRLIFHVQHTKDFTMISNRMLNDPSLSFKAKGLLCFLLSKPQEWETRSDALSNVGPDGQTSCRSALKELQTRGYASLERSRGAGGRMAGTHWHIYERPIPESDRD